MAKSLKEALLEQMAALQERGLAPGEIPEEQEEQNYYGHYDDDASGRSGGGAGDREPRRRGVPAGRTQRAPRLRTPAPRREPRELREPRRERRDSRESRDIPSDLVGPMPAPPPRPMGPRPGGFGGPPRGPIGPGQPRPGPIGPRPPARSDMLRRNAERIQREQADRAGIQQLLTTYSGEEADEAAIEKFFARLGVETGALPPLHVVLEALRSAGNAEPAEVGNQVRLYYRRSRARSAPAPVGVS